MRYKKTNILIILLILLIIEIFLIPSDKIFTKAEENTNQESIDAQSEAIALSDGIYWNDGETIKVSGSYTGEVNIYLQGGTVYLASTIIAGNSTDASNPTKVTISGYGTIKRGLKDDGEKFNDRFFDVYSEGELIIKGDSENGGIIIDGENIPATTGMRIDNALTLENVTMKNFTSNELRWSDDALNGDTNPLTGEAWNERR